MSRGHGEEFVDGLLGYRARHPRGAAETPVMTEETPAALAAVPGPVLRGTPVAPGLALGTAHRKDHDLFRVQPQRVPRDQVEHELNRFHRALSASEAQLADLKQYLGGKVPVDHVRILDTHVAYLKDTVFLSDVENLILNEQMSLEAAIVKVISDFDRIFRLVENELLRERAVDLRDVGIRVLRNLETASAEAPEEEAEASARPRDYVLVARQLSIVDMFNLENEHVLGIVTEEGGLTSHAAILARSMHIPTVTGIDNLLDLVQEGDHLIVDAAEGVLRVNAEEVVRSQFNEERAGSSVGTMADDGERPEWAVLPAHTADGAEVRVASACGSLPEVELSSGLGFSGVGLYRTELMYLVERKQPSLDSLVAHYRSVVERAGGEPVTFRLLDVDSSLDVDYLFDGREDNPALGRAGIRALLAHEQVLRTQLQAILRVSSDDTPVRIAVPFVLDSSDVRRVKELLFEERFALRRLGAHEGEFIAVGAVVETPSAALSALGLIEESDFLLISLDNLLQHFLGADRGNHELRGLFEPIHPTVLRALRELAQRSEEIGKPVAVFGESVLSPINLALLLGCGLREFCVSPVALESFLAGVARVDAGEALRVAVSASQASCQADALPLIDGLTN